MIRLELIEIKQGKKEDNKIKLQNKLNILNEEYKMLVNQKIKELASANNEMAREIIENTYKELEEEKANKLKTAVEYFDEIIKSEVPNRMILQMLIDKIYINREKMIRFELKTDIEKMI